MQKQSDIWGLREKMPISHFLTSHKSPGCPVCFFHTIILAQRMSLCRYVCHVCSSTRTSISISAMILVNYYTIFDTKVNLPCILLGCSDFFFNWTINIGGTFLGDSDVTLEQASAVATAESAHLVRYSVQKFFIK